MPQERPTKMYTVMLAAALVAVVATAVWEAPKANWDWALFGTLLGFSAFSDLMSIETESRLKISANFLSLITAIVYVVLMVVIFWKLATDGAPSGTTKAGTMCSGSVRATCSRRSPVSPEATT